MANKSVFKKSLVIGTILLFIGASVVPSICEMKDIEILNQLSLMEVTLKDGI
jgi:hypothetical protein